MDGISRLLSVLGILVAGGGSAYLYQENQVLKDRVSQLPTKTDLQTVTGVGGDADTSEAAANAFNERWNTQLVEALETFKTRAEDRINTLDQALTARELEFTRKVNELAVDSPSIDESKVLSLVERKYRELELQATRPDLRLARNVMKPIGEGYDNSIAIRNVGRDDATITSVTLRPSRIFETNSSLTMSSSVNEQVVIRFDKDDNTATEPRTHHVYTRSLSEALTIPGNSYVRVIVEIENSIHLDHGLEGVLELTYDDGEVLTLPNVRADFVAGETDSV